MQYAYKINPTSCKVCNEIHYYATNKHVVITGTLEELEHAKLSLGTIEPYDSEKCDIKDCMNVFGHYPELDTFTRNGISGNIATSLPGYSYGFTLKEIKVSEDKNEVIITYRR